MYTLLIIDDEPIIADGLYEEFKHYRDERGLAMDIYRVYSGKEALRMLAERKVDIVVSDIRMPGVDGLELLRRVRMSWPACRVIFLTGYREFEYAHEAITHGVARYILKTEGYAKVIEAVEEMKREIERGLQADALAAEAEQKLQLAEALQRRFYLTDVLHGLAPTNGEELDQFGAQGVTLRADKPVWLAAGRFDQPGFHDRFPTYETRKSAMETTLLLGERYLSPRADCAGIIAESGTLVWLLQPPVGEAVFADDFGPFLRGMLETLQNACRQSLNATLSCAASAEPSGLSGLPGNYANLCGILKYKDGLSANEELLHMGRNGARDRSTEETIATVKAYAERHLHEDISLVKLADLVDLNPTYLSRFFKQHTGLTLSDFIQEMRLERAKQLLADPSVRVQDIAVALGYGSASNFGRSFKKLMGQTPQEYREETFK